MLLDSQPIEIEDQAFGCRGAIANLVLPQGSSATENYFEDCALLRHRFGNEAGSVVAGLEGRFVNLPVHKLCYDHFSTTAEELRRCIEDQEEMEASLVDEFGMTPFHALFLTPQPSGELLEILLDTFPNYVMDCNDANGKRPLDYLVSNWTEITASLLQTTLQRRIVDPFVRWGATSWTEAMVRRVQAILVEL
jgi:hypothetical protein